MPILQSKTDPTSIPQLNATSDVWINWHKVLKNNFGKKEANTLWIKAWYRRKGPNSSTNELRTYMHGQGIDIEKSYGESVMDSAFSFVDFFGDYLTLGKYVGIGLTVIIVGGLGMIVFNLAKNPAKNIGIAAKALI